tara:strand:- start:272 stop:454 length:183 start_codon:yes stop_codon:yes gene_type:complete
MEHTDLYDQCKDTCETADHERDRHPKRDTQIVIDIHTTPDRETPQAGDHKERQDVKDDET